MSELINGDGSSISGDMPEDAPKIEFPLDYPIKVIGDNRDGFSDDVSKVIVKFDPKFDGRKIKAIPSRKGTFVSLRLTIWATGKEQLADLHQALLKVSGVKTVL